MVQTNRPGQNPLNGTLECETQNRIANRQNIAKVVVVGGITFVALLVCRNGKRSVRTLLVPKTTWNKVFHCQLAEGFILAAVNAQLRKRIHELVPDFTMAE